VPVHVSEEITRLRRLERTLERELGREPARNELEERFAQLELERELVNAVKSNLTARFDRKPTADELEQDVERARAKFYDQHGETVRAQAPQKIEELKRHALELASLDLVVGEGGSTLGEFVVDESEEPLAELIELETAAEVQKLMVDLPPRHAAVLRLRLGLGNDGPRTLEQIGSKLGLSGEVVRRLEQEVIDLSRRLLRERHVA